MLVNLMVEGAWSIGLAGRQVGPQDTDRPASVDRERRRGRRLRVRRASVGPYVGLLVGGEALSGGTLTSAKFFPNGVIALGLDYRLSPHLAVGAALRQQFTAVESSTYPSFTQAFARLEYTTWGW